MKPQFFAPDIAGAAHLTGAHRLGHRAFNACSFGIQHPKLRSALSLARVLQSGVTLVIWTQNQHFRPSFGTVSMKRTRSANWERKPDPKSWLAVPVRDMSPILTGLPGRTADPFGLPINVKVAVIKPVCCL